MKIVPWCSVLLLGVAAFLPSSCGETGEPPFEGADAPWPGPGERRDDDPPTARRDMLEHLREAMAEIRHSSDGGGRAWLELAEGEEAVTTARTRSSWTIGYETGPEGIAAGGFIRLTVPRFWYWTPPQTEYEGGAGYTTAECEVEGVSFETRDLPGFWVDFIVKGKPLSEGDRVRIHYGAGPAGAVSDRYAESGSAFWISVDGDGDEVAALLDDSPTIDVLAGPPSRLVATLPSTAEPGDEVVLRLAVLDEFGCAGTDFEGSVLLSSLVDGLELPDEVAFTSQDRGVKRVPFVASESAVHRIVAAAKGAHEELSAVSNPMLVEADLARIRWADLHGHSNLSDGTGTPEEYLTYARDVAGLDIVSLTDHDHWGMLFLDEHPELWEAIQEETQRFHDPGTFVTLLGYEWTSWIDGHRHVVAFGDELPLLSSVDPDYERPDQLWDGLRGLPVLTFAHHSAGGPIATNWDYAPDPELETVTEIVSVHGASEAPDAPFRIYSPVAGNFVRDVLDRGYRLGFVGSGDSHDGHPGLAHLASPSRAGLAAILTEELTRDGVYGALKERHTYATNGPRMILRAALNASRMGSVVPPTEPDEPALLYTRAIGTAPLQVIQVVRSGEVVDELECEEGWDVAHAVSLEDLEAGEYVYVRVIQTDGGMACSSPFFVE